MITAHCYLCQSRNPIKLAERTRDRAPLGVLKCPGCGLIYLESSDHISDAFYENSGMHVSPGDAREEIVRMRRDTYADDDRRTEFCKERMAGKRVLDFGCGWGGFLKLMRDRGVTDSLHGVELEARFREHMAKREGFDVRRNVSEFGGKFDFITLFHCLEHIKDPSALLKELTGYLAPGGEILVEVPSGEDALISLFESRKFMEFTFWSCHLFLFTPSNIPALAGKAQVRLNWCTQVQRYPLANHLHWLSKGKPGGHKEWHFLRDANVDRAYADALARAGKCDTILFSVGAPG